MAAVIKLKSPVLGPHRPSSPVLRSPSKEPSVGIVLPKTSPLLRGVGVLSSPTSTLGSPRTKLHKTLSVMPDLDLEQKYHEAMRKEREDLLSPGKSKRRRETQWVTVCSSDSEDGNEKDIGVTGTKRRRRSHSDASNHSSRRSSTSSEGSDKGGKKKLHHKHHKKHKHHNNKHHRRSKKMDETGSSGSSKHKHHHHHHKHH